MYDARVKEKETNTVDTNRLLADPLAVHIVAAVDQAALTLHDLASMLGVSERRLMHRLQNLVRARAIVQRQHRGHTVYAAGERELTMTCRILYALWGREARRARSRCVVAI